MAALIWGSLAAGDLRAQPIHEYQMKAAYLYNFVKFVEWPEQAFHSARDPVVICVLDQKLLLRTLEEAVHGQRVDIRRVAIRQVADIQHVDGCHILFIGSMDSKHVASVIRNLKVSGVLTVSEAEGFTGLGGAVNLRLEGLRIRVAINLSAVAQQNLRISPRLLSLARVVKE